MTLFDTPMTKLILTLLFTISTSAFAASHGEKAGHGHKGAHANVQVLDAWARELPPVSPNGAVYLVISNHGDQADRLSAVSTGASARAVCHHLQAPPV